MPLNPSGHTPTSSPPRSRRSASSLQASVVPPLRARVLTTGDLKTRSAPSGPQEPAGHGRGSITIGHQAVDREGAGVVGDHQRAALGGDVLDAAHLDAEPLLRDRAQRGHEEPLGDLLVEAVLVDDVVTGHPAAQEGEEAGQLGLPLVAEQLAGGVLERRRASRRPGCRRSGRRSSVRTPGRGSARRPGARRSRWRRRTRSVARSDSAASARPLGASSFAGADLRAPPARLREAADGLPLPWPRPGRPRVPIGMISASPTGTTSHRVERRASPRPAAAGRGPR